MITLDLWRFSKCGLQIPRGPQDTLSGSAKGQNYFHNTINMLFAFFTVVTFALMVYRQWWIKLLGPWSETRQWHQTILEVMPSLPTMHLKKKKEKNQFHLSISLMKQ